MRARAAQSDDYVKYTAANRKTTIEAVDVFRIGFDDLSFPKEKLFLDSLGLQGVPGEAVWMVSVIQITGINERSTLMFFDAMEGDEADVKKKYLQVIPENDGPKVGEDDPIVESLLDVRGYYSKNDDSLFFEMLRNPTWRWGAR